MNKADFLVELEDILYWIQLVAEDGFANAFFHRLKKANWIM